MLSGMCDRVLSFNATCVFICRPLNFAAAVLAILMGVVVFLTSIYVIVQLCINKRKTSKFYIFEMYFTQCICRCICFQLCVKLVFFVLSFPNNLRCYATTKRILNMQGACVSDGNLKVRPLWPLKQPINTRFKHCFEISYGLIEYPSCLVKTFFKCIFSYFPSTTFFRSTF